jgi:diphthamide biosynthesis enzyme Dph1/Dph2-like protein
MLFFFLLRYYLVERARGASMVGLLVGTLGAAGYKTALEQLRHLAAEVGGTTTMATTPCVCGCITGRTLVSCAQHSGV